MSAYIVSNAHVLTIAYHYNKLINKNLTKDEKADRLIAETTASVFLKENVKSVNYRYSEKTRLPKFTANDQIWPDISNVQLYKLICCLEYQSCEHTGWNKSNSKRMLQDFRAYLADQIICESDEYEVARWSI